MRLLKDEFGVKYVGVWQAFQSYWNGVDPNGEATIGRHEGLDTAAVRHFGNALINCMGMALENYWHRPVSPIVRSSDDYLPHNPRSLAEHVMQNAFNALLMGELYHCDWDMLPLRLGHVLERTSPRVGAWHHAGAERRPGVLLRCRRTYGRGDAARSVMPRR